MFYLSYGLNWLVKTELIEQIKPLKPIKQMKRLPADCQLKPGAGRRRDVNESET
jgi:hypothetical protein